MRDRKERIKGWVLAQINIKPSKLDRLVWNIEPHAVSVSEIISIEGNNKLLKNIFSEELPKELRVKDNRKIDYPTSSFSIEKHLAKEAERDYHFWEQNTIIIDPLIYQ